MKLSMPKNPVARESIAELRYMKNNPSSSMRELASRSLILYGILALVGSDVAR